MKKSTKLLTIGLGAIAALNFASCQDYTEFTEDQIRYEAKLNEFYKNFVNEFGEPDPNHTWGFGEIGDIDPSKYWQNGRTTRAGGNNYGQPGFVDNNVNMWTNNDPNAMCNRIHVPGWPNDDGKYYTTSGIKDASDVSGWQYKTTAGDVTNSEIKQVSKLLREHTGVELQEYQVSLHLSDFFIQQVSSDYDRVTPDGDIAHPIPGQDYQCNMDYLEFKSLDGGTTHVNDFNAHQNFNPLDEHATNNYRKIKYVTSAGTEDFSYECSLTNDGSKRFNKWILIKYTFNDADMGGLQRTGYYLCFDYEARYKNGNGTTETCEGDGYYNNWIVKITPGVQTQGDRWPKRFMCEDLGNTYDFDFNDAVFDLTFSTNINDKSYYDAILTIRAAGGTMPIYVAMDPNGDHGGVNVSKYEIHNLLGHSSSQPVNVISGIVGEPAIYRIYKVFEYENASNLYERATRVENEVTMYGWLDQYNNIWWSNGAETKPTKPANDTHNYTFIPYTILKPDADFKHNIWAQMAKAAFTLQIYVSKNVSGTEYWPTSGYNVQRALRDTNPGNGFNNGAKGTNAIPQLLNCSIDARWTKENQHINDAYKYFKEWVQYEQGDYRLRWDEKEYFQRSGDGTTANLVSHSESEVSSWNGSWDFGPKDSDDPSGWINNTYLW